MSVGMERSNVVHDCQPGRSGRHSPATPAFQMFRPPQPLSNARASRSVDGRSPVTPTARGNVHVPAQTAIDLWRPGYPAAVRHGTRPASASHVMGAHTSAVASMPATLSGACSASSSTSPAQIHWAWDPKGHTSFPALDEPQTPPAQKAPEAVTSALLKAALEVDETPPKLSNPHLVWEQRSIPTPQRMPASTPHKLSSMKDHTPTARAPIQVAATSRKSAVGPERLSSSAVASMEQSPPVEFAAERFVSAPIVQAHSSPEQQPQQRQHRVSPPAEMRPLPDFSVTDARYGTAAASRSLDKLPHSIRHALNFIRSLPALPNTQLPPGKNPFLPPQCFDRPRPVLVLDLDETLVHCSRGEGKGANRILNDSAVPPDVIVDFEDIPAHGAVAFRPHAKYFLELVAKSFEVVIFTASQQVYADKVVNALDPRGNLIHHRLYRQHCTEFRGAYFKELGLLGRPIDQCLLVDNSPISVACNADNGVLCRSWYDDQSDKELVDLLHVLREMRARGGRVDGFLAKRYGLSEFFKAIRESS